MITGYNHNVKYKDQVYHVQTEDSGVQNPHVITHLFVGGNIIETRKTSYADVVKSERLEEVVVELMQGQHKGMLKDLINGKFDSKIVERSKNAAKLNGPAPLNVEAGAQNRGSFGLTTPVTAPASQPGAAAKPAAKPPTPITVPTTPAAKPIAPAAATATPTSQPTVPRPAPVSPTAAPRPVASPAARPVAPPPAAAAARANIGSPPPAAVPRPPTPAPAPAPIAADAPAPAPSATNLVLEAETLQKAFDSKDESTIDSIFGEDLISEKSLDEVILSYLAEDMQKE